MDISIIIVNHQTCDFLKQCLMVLDAGARADNREIIVVDNNSQDSSVNMMRQEFPYVNLICLDENVGFSRANNIGIKNAKGKFLVLLNSDTEVDQNIISEMIAYMEKNKNVGILGCRQLDSNGNLQLAFGKFPTFYREMIRKFLHTRLATNNTLVREYIETKYNGRVDVDWVSGSCMVVRREAIEDAGMFDPDFFMYFEDIDLCCRIKEKGWKIYYNTGFTILHHGGITARQNLARSYVEYRRSQFHFCRKYYGVRGLVILKILVFTKFLLAATKSGLYFVLNIFTEDCRQRELANLVLCKKMMEMSIKGTVKVT